MQQCLISLPSGYKLDTNAVLYGLQEQGLDTVDANRALGLPDDCREYTSVRNILRDVNVKSVRLVVSMAIIAACYIWCIAVASTTGDFGEHHVASVFAVTMFVEDHCTARGPCSTGHMTPSSLLVF